MSENESKMKECSRTEDEKTIWRCSLNEDETDGDLASGNNTTCSYSIICPVVAEKVRTAFLHPRHESDYYSSGEVCD